MTSLDDPAAPGVLWRLTVQDPQTGLYIHGPRIYTSERNMKSALTRWAPRAKASGWKLTREGCARGAWLDLSEAA